MSIEKGGINDSLGRSLPVDGHAGAYFNLGRQPRQQTMSRCGNRCREQKTNCNATHDRAETSRMRAVPSLFDKGSTKHVYGSSLPFHAESMVVYGNQPVKHREIVTWVDGFLNL